MGIEQTESLRRLNWALSAYASSLKALTHARDLQELMSSVCKAVVEGEIYALCWIGLIDTSDSKLNLRICAAAGEGIGYVEGLKLSASDNVPEGQGPTGIALRSGVPFIAHDMLTAPEFAPWRKKAARYGFRSSVTVPFREGVLGAISVYSRQSDAFGPSELNLFSHLGEEIAFAMSIYEERARKKLSEETAERAEAALREAQADFFRVSRVAVLGEFALVIAHEINQPLAAIATNVDASLRWLENSPPNIDEARLALHRIRENSDRTNEIVKRVRVLFSKGEPSHKTFDVNDAIREVLGFLSGELRRGSVVLRAELGAGIPKAWGDRVQIQQVVSNLILNAIEAMQTVSNRQRLLQVNTRTADAGRILVEVNDAGVGLDPTIQQHLFERFFTTKPGGTGLGLAISQSIIEAHSGRLWASSDDDWGATFRFTLPVAK